MQPDTRLEPYEIGGVAIDNGAMTRRRHLVDLLAHEPRSISSLARELGMTRGAVEDDLRHAIRTARAHGHDIDVVPARCKTCDFVFAPEKLVKPSRCPACKGTRLYEPMIGFSLRGSAKDTNALKEHLTEHRREAKR